MSQEPPSDGNIVRAHIQVKGRVQGVGFRAHIEYRARQIGGLAGWVRNVGYDTVEAVAEGERGNVERLIEEMKEDKLKAKDAEFDAVHNAAAKPTSSPPKFQTVTDRIAADSPFVLICSCICRSSGHFHRIY